MEVGISVVAGKHKQCVWHKGCFPFSHEGINNGVHNGLSKIFEINYVFFGHIECQWACLGSCLEETKFAKCVG